MTRSIFDPEGGETEHSGTRNLGPSADNNSHMPPDIVDGVVSEVEADEDSSGGIEALEKEARANDAAQNQPERAKPPL